MDIQRVLMDGLMSDAPIRHNQIPPQNEVVVIGRALILMPHLIHDHLGERNVHYLCILRKNRLTLVMLNHHHGRPPLSSMVENISRAEIGILYHS